MNRSSMIYASGAVLLWSTSALLTSHAVVAGPPWLVTAVSFSIAALTGGLVAARRGRTRAAFRGGRAAWLLGAIFTSYYLAYYQAFAAAPDARVEVNLLNYLWPLLTVLLSAPLLGARLPGRIVLAALMALAGAGLVVTQGQAPHLARAHAVGYLLGLWAGVSWAVFSCLLRRFGPAGAGRMPFYSALTAAVAWVVAARLGQCGQWAGWRTWLPGTLYLGVGTLGLAFDLWDRALQTGDVARIGLLSYLIPVLSTLLLALDEQRITRPTVAGMILVIGSAMLGNLSTEKRENRSESPRSG